MQEPLRHPGRGASPADFFQRVLFRRRTRAQPDRALHEYLHCPATALLWEEAFPSFDDGTRFQDAVGGQGQHLVNLEKDHILRFVVVFDREDGVAFLSERFDEFQVVFFFSDFGEIETFPAVAFTVLDEVILCMRV